MKWVLKGSLNWLTLTCLNIALSPPWATSGDDSEVMEFGVFISTIDG